MTPLHTASDQLVNCCRQLLSGELGMLNDLQHQDISRMLDGSLRFRTWIYEFGLTKDYILSIQLEQDFVSMGHISHELRGILGSVVGFTQMLLMDMAGELLPEQMHCLQQIDDHCADIEATIFDYFDRERNR